MSVEICPQCQEPVSVASGSGRNYCNLCGWVDTHSDEMSAAERILQQKRDLEHEKRVRLGQDEAFTARMRAGIRPEDLDREDEQKQKEKSSYPETSKIFNEGMHTLSLMGSRFPILNVLIVIFYGLACLFVLASGMALFSDTGTGNIRFAVFLFFLFIAAGNMAVAEVLKLFLAMESHLHIVRLSVSQNVIVDDSQ